MVTILVRQQNRETLGGANREMTMSSPDSPLKRPIGARNVVRLMIAVGAVIAIFTAFDEQRIGLAVASTLFLVVAVPAAYWVWRFRKSVADDSSSTKRP